MADITDVLRVKTWDDTPLTYPVVSSTTRTSDVRRLVIDRGLTGGHGSEFAVGTARVTFDNRTNKYTPGIGTLAPFRDQHLTVEASDDAFVSSTDLIHGWLDRPDAWTTSVDGEADYQFSDSLRWLGQYELDGTTNFLRKFSGDRIRDILAVTGVDADQWPAANFDRGHTQMAAAPRLQGNVKTLINEAAKADGGYFYVDGSGAFHYRAREFHNTHSPWANSQVDFVDSGAGGGVPIVATPTFFSNTFTEEFATRVTCAARSGEQQVADGTTAGDFPITRDLGTLDMTFDASAANLARMWAQVWADETAFPLSIRFKVWTKADTQPTAPMTAIVDDLDVLNRITVKYKPAMGATQQNVACSIRRIKHDITPAEWWCEIELMAWDARWSDANMWTFGSTDQTKTMSY